MSESVLDKGGGSCRNPVASKAYRIIVKHRFIRLGYVAFCIQINLVI